MTLETVAARAFGRDVVVDGWSSEPIAHRRINRVTGELLRYEFRAHDRGGQELRVRAVCKTLQGSASEPGAEPDRFDPSQEPTHWNYWRREYDANGSNVLRSLPDGLRAPRCFWREANDASATMWFEYVDGTPAREWDDGAFHRAGDAVGRWQKRRSSRTANAAGRPVALPFVFARLDIR